MEIAKIKEALNAVALAGDENRIRMVDYIYASDLMSDVLAFGKSHSLLLTGLATRQAVISAHMAEFAGVVFIRGKIPKDDSIQCASEYNLLLYSTKLDMYESCIKIQNIVNGAPAVSPAGEGAPRTDGMSLAQEFSITGNDFANAGMISTEVKSILKKIGFDSKLVRRIAISTYEAEMNVIMHARRASVTLSVTPQQIEVVLDDEGKGIPNVDMAMQEGYSTATEEMRAMGFGSGMGLPNIKKNTDKLNITSEVDRGTTVRMTFFV